MLCGSHRFSLQTQIGGIEFRDRGQPRPIQDFDLAAGPVDQALGAQLGDQTIDMDRRQAQHVAQYGLRQWKPEASVFHPSHDLKAQIEFAQQMGQAAEAAAAADDGQPLPVDRRVDQGVQPQQSGQMRVIFRKGDKFRVRR